MLSVNSKFFIKILPGIFFLHLCYSSPHYPRVIWSHWDDKPMGDDILEMVHVTRKSLRNFTYNLITPKNISKFIDMNSFPKLYRELIATVKSDYIRVCLLANYGGVYVDASTYINSGMEMEWVFWKSIKSKASAVAFKTPIYATYQISSHFIGGSLGSVIMKKYKSNFDFALSGDHLEEYVKRACSELSRRVIEKFVCKYEKRNIHHAVFTRIMLEDNGKLKKEMLLLPSDRSPIKLSLECRFSDPCIRNRLLFDSIARNYPFIKLSHKTRTGKKFHIGEKKKDAEQAANMNN